MFVHIKAVQRENFRGVWRAGRFWPSSEALKVEVVKEEPALKVEDILDQTGKKTGTREVPDMTKIGAATLEALRHDGRVSVLQDGETDAGASKAAVAAKARIAELEAENAGLKETIETLTAQLADQDDDVKAAKHHEGKGAKR